MFYRFKHSVDRLSVFVEVNKRLLGIVKNSPFSSGVLRAEDEENQMELEARGISLRA